jgi:hypothetical protein
MLRMNDINDPVAREAYLERQAQGDFDDHRESDELAELDAALEAHCIAMDKLTDALAQVRRQLFGE